MADRLVAILMRHGSALHEDELMAGRGCDFPLSDEGVVQAHKGAEFLKTQEIGQIICSPMLRAVQTAEIVAGVLGGRCIEQCRCFFPWALGPEFDGQPKDSKAEEVAYLIAHPKEKPTHGNSLIEFRDEVGDGLECKFNPFAPPLIITHSNVICVVKDLVTNTMDSCPGLEDGVTPAGVIGIYEEGEDDYCFKVLHGSE